MPLNQGLFADFRYVIHGCQREFSLSSPHKAIEDQNSRMIEAIANSPELAKLTSHPAAMPAIRRWVQVLHEEGYDFVDNRAMSMSMLFKMASNQRLRESAIELREELKNAGIEFSQEDVLAFFRALQNQK
ncbi:hypothetical protein FRC15_002404 [Serendipita sp. 397]|nr:hypothetical protein FRC15_002404 [Serendipita sp. 397]